MIETISISTIATYSGAPEVLGGLKKVNFLFGANGSGKTTISRIIADEGSSVASKVTWAAGRKLRAMVYNQDYVEKNFNQPRELKGVFTLGAKDAAVLSKIETAKGEQDAIEKRIADLTLTLSGEDGAGGKLGDLKRHEEEFKQRFWKSKQRHDEEFRGPLRGTMNDKESFKTKVLEEREKNKAELLTLDALRAKALALFGATPATIDSLPSINGDDLLGHESNAILKKVVVGKEDVNIAAMIKKLGNSDWVQEGRQYFDSNDGYCPFCQQEAPQSLEQELEDYFDESFTADMNSIDALIEKYRNSTQKVQESIKGIIDRRLDALDLDSLKAQQTALDSIIASNLLLLTEKKRVPSQIVQLKPTSNVLASAETLVSNANDAIEKHNQMVGNLSKERTALTAQVWKYIVEEELKADLESYLKGKQDINKAIEGVNLKLKDARADLESKKLELLTLEKQVSSVKPTVDGINKILKSFGFTAFQLKISPTGTAYQLVREDGSLAKETLSEGEKSFVCFLYFFFSLKGSETESGVMENRIVVIDDPVSSLDSEVLFVVSTLIKELVSEVQKKGGTLKQIFVLTHNVYFHKEVTHKQKGSKGPKDETFWVVRKRDGRSGVVAFEVNPVKSSYDLLWQEVRNPDRSKLTIQNTLRRILEHYFKILGGADLDAIGSWFEGSDKLIFKSLISWTHDGSHSVQDDLSVTIDDDAAVEANLRVFKAIFDNSRHAAHYEMMMGETA